MSFVQGLSGLNAASKDLEVIGNNVANVNTVGFKASQAQFADVFAASLGGAGSSQIGIGTKLATVAQQFTQGSISTTNNPLDMAVNGPGFFVVHGVNGTGYSRNGQFQVDKSGNIVTSTGLNLQGWPAVGGAVATSGPTSNLTIPTANIPPVATSTMTVAMNLDSRLQPPTVSPFDPTNPQTFSNSTSTTVYDTLGNALINTMYFVKAPIVPASADTASSIVANGAGSATVSVASVAGLVQGETVTIGGVANTIASVNAATNTFTTGAAVAGVPLGATAITYGPTATVPANTGITTAVTPTGNVQTVTVANTIGLFVGQPVTINGVSTVITSIPNATSFTTAQNTLANAAPNVISFGAMTGNAWNVYMTESDPNVPGAFLFPTPTPAAGAWRATGALTFNNSGLPATTVPTWYTTPNPASLTIPSISAAHPVVTYNFSGATQFGAAFGVTQITADGNTSGSLVGYSASADGTISGTYSNGKTQKLGQVALATFADNQGLQPLGNNEWAATNASGAALTGVPGTGLNGVIQTASVEGSNTDLTAELVNMITAQRNYQANAQTIKTQDAVMQTLISMR